MIPALLAAPMVEGVLGKVMNLFSPAPAPAAGTPSFAPYLNRASATSFGAPHVGTASSGIMTSATWSQLGASDLASWMQGLVGQQVQATDLSGRTISGVVGSVSQNGGVPALTIGGHLVSLSQLNQINWSPSVK